jgi:hypothetical protein
VISTRVDFVMEVVFKNIFNLKIFYYFLIFYINTLKYLKNINLIFYKKNKNIIHYKS